MKQKVLKIEFFQNRELINAISKCPASMEQVMSACAFLDTDCTIHISVVENEVSLPVK